MKILDCTLRDGGYYTNWDFNKQIVDHYIECTNLLPIDYIEVGYRNNPSKDYLGKYAYCPLYELTDIREKSIKKISVMLDEKNVTLTDLYRLTEPIQGLVDMLRIAVDPKNFARSLSLVEALKKQNFEVGVNMMYMSKWKSMDKQLLPQLSNLNGLIDSFCMVDSFGGITPDDIIETTELVKEYTNVPIGFHGHNNLELAFINTLTAIKCKVDFVDATILGMGRGAGNLKTELLLTYLNNTYNLDINFNALGKIIMTFEALMQKYKWGTNLPYMISGITSLPQKDIMEWVNNRRYSFNSIVRALNNKKEKIKDNEKFPVFIPSSFENALLIGGGINAVNHVDGIKEFMKNKDFVIIHATARNALSYLDVDVPQYFCLVGSEGERLEQVFKNTSFNAICLLPPFPRLMGTYVPIHIKAKTFELYSIDFTDLYLDSCTTLALQTALSMNVKNVFAVGYDGYMDGLVSSKERELSIENTFLFDSYSKYCGNKIISLTPTLYSNLITMSVYQEL